MAELSRDHLWDLAGQKSFDRGLDYLGRVSGLRKRGKAVHATVGGRRRYRVRLTAEGAFSWHCDCPWAQEGNCCKHVVAVGLVHLYEREHGGAAPSVPDIASHLDTLDRKQLVELLLEVSESWSAPTRTVSALPLWGWGGAVNHCGGSGEQRQHPLVILDEAIARAHSVLRLGTGERPDHGDAVHAPGRRSCVQDVIDRRLPGYSRTLKEPPPPQRAAHNDASGRSRSVWPSSTVQRPGAKGQFGMDLVQVFRTGTPDGEERVTRHSLRLRPAPLPGASLAYGERASH